MPIKYRHPFITGRRDAAPPESEAKMTNATEIKKVKAAAARTATAIRNCPCDGDWVAMGMRCDRLLQKARELGVDQIPEIEAIIAQTDALYESCKAESHERRAARIAYQLKAMRPSTTLNALENGYLDEVRRAVR
jgi:hypothetical protein